MFNRLTGLGRASVPNLVVSQRMIDRMRTAADHFIEDETGEAMIGLVVPGTHTNGVPTIYALDTISPDDTAVRMMHTFQQGDARQDELIWWLQENWHLQRGTRRADDSLWATKWDVPLRYLGDWHKQPGYMIHPSGGDLMTALDWIADEENRAEFLLAPILTLDHPLAKAGDALNADGIANHISVPNSDGTSALRIDFWYIDKRARVFAPISPVVYPSEQLPLFAPYPWHLVDEARFDEEYKRMQSDGLFSALVLWDADGAAPLEICFLTARAGSSQMIIVVTPHDYPTRAPSLRVAPLLPMRDADKMYDVFKEAWAAARAVDLPLTWLPDLHLVDAIRAYESHNLTESDARASDAEGAS
ncbi:MAG: hypothetical protein SGI73_21360 [Chloroflexota bacterium]|nr:hypothetical protein [Chloroflexota bacterium]